LYTKTRLAYIFVFIFPLHRQKEEKFYDKRVSSKFHTLIVMIHVCVEDNISLWNASLIPNSKHRTQHLQFLVYILLPASSHHRTLIPLESLIEFTFNMYRNELIILCCKKVVIECLQCHSDCYCHQMAAQVVPQGGSTWQYVQTPCFSYSSMNNEQRQQNAKYQIMLWRLNWMGSLFGNEWWQNSTKTRLHFQPVIYAYRSLLTPPQGMHERR